MNKKQFFKDKVNQVTYSIWDLEFKVSKSRQVREGVRQDRDRAMESVASLEARLKTETNKDEVLKIEGEKKATEDNIKRYESQMLMIDKQINGFTGNENEESVVGILEQLKSLAELREMYKAHIKSI